MTRLDTERTAGGRVLVTGGAGFIGSHVVEGFVATGWHVEILDNLSSGDTAGLPNTLPVHVADIRSEAEVQAVFAFGRFDAVVHCAAQTSVGRSMKEPALDRDVNVHGTAILLRAALLAGVSRFVYVSSGGAVYGETSSPAVEPTMPAPRSYYGLHKYAAEELIREAGISYAILRPSNVYGPRQRADAEGGVMSIFAQRLLAGQPLEIHGDGRQVRDFVYVTDVVSATIAALSTQEDVTWNVASGESTTIRELASAMASAIQRPLETHFGPPREGDVHQSLLSPAALMKTGWGPPISLASGLRLMLAGLRKLGDAPSPAAVQFLADTQRGSESMRYS